MFLRLDLQYESAGLGDVLLKRDIRALIPSTVNNLLPPQKACQLRPGHLSPLDSPLGSAIVYILSVLWRATSSDNPAVDISEDSNWAAAIQTLQNAITTAATDNSLGGDEVLYGRAGLLWAMLNLQTWVTAPDVPKQLEQDLAAVVNSKTIEQVIARIIEAGKAGAKWYARNYGEEPWPLMWPWHDSFYVGA